MKSPRRANQASASPAVRYRGQSYTQIKRYWQGTHRTCAPSETLQNIRPLFAEMGLTRLANVTGLDCLGLPVVLSVRPNSAYLSVDAGKGVSLEDAAASAAMECLERYTAEKVRLPEFCCAYQDLAGDFETVPIQNLPLTRHSLFHPGLMERWCLGWDLMAQGEVAVPAGMVTLLGRHRSRKDDLFCFQTGSNGLASGNNFLEALCAALNEVIERDAVTCWRMMLRATGRPIPRVRLETIELPLVRDVLNRFAAARVQPILLDCTTDTKVPTYMAYIYDLSERNMGIYRGYGAHLDPEVAMVRALNEAAQGRLVYISGARDDFFHADYLRLRKADDQGAIAYYEAMPATVDAGGLVSRSTGTFEGDFALLSQGLAQVGLTQIIAFDLTLPGHPVSVVRAIVPGLEGYLFNYYAPGPRALAHVAQAKALASQEAGS